MSIKDEFAPQDWQQITSLPALVAAAVINGDLSSLPGLIEEGKALYAVLADARTNPDANPVAQAAAEDILARKDNPPQPAIQQDSPVRVEDLYTRIREILPHLDAGTDTETSAGYRRWLYSVAKATAEAAREEGLFGFRGPWVSAQEREVLDHLSQILA